MSVGIVLSGGLSAFLVAATGAALIENYHAHMRRIRLKRLIERHRARMRRAPEGPIALMRMFDIAPTSARNGSQRR